jgi:glycosyltransferase involved in cell wall biosynthesis
MPLKGVDILVRAMATLVRTRPDARLIIAGDGPERANLTALAGSLGVSDVVQFAGHVARPALDELLGVGWVQCVPSRYLEPFANTIVEAMMRGTAVVASAVGGTPEIVRDGVTGYLVPSGDAPAVADRLLRLLERRDLAEQMGAAGRAIALADFTVDRMVDRFEQVYLRLAA